MRFFLDKQHSKLAAILDDIITQASMAKQGSGFSIAMNGKITQAYP